MTAQRWRHVLVPAEPGPAPGPQVIFGFDADGICTMSIGPGLEHLGLRPGELVGRNLFDVYTEASSHESMHRVLAGETFTVERELGGRRLSVYYQSLVDDDGKVTGALGVATDVTEHRRMERAEQAALSRASLFAELSGVLSRDVRDLDALLRVAIRSMTEAIAEWGVLWLRSPEGSHPERRASWPAGDGIPPPSYDPPTLTRELQGVEVLEIDGHSVLRVALRSRGTLLGLVDLARDAAPFAEDEVSLAVELAERAALAIDNALLFLSERRAHEDLLKFKALADASKNFIAISDEEDRLLYVNPSARDQRFSLSEEDVWRTVTAHVPEGRADEVRRALMSEGRWSGDLQLTVGGETRVAFLDVFRLFHPETAEPLGSAWIAQELTELRATEAALREALSDIKQFKALVEASPDFIAIANLDGTVKYVNPPGRELIGLDPGVDVTTTTIADYLTPEGLRASVEVEQPAVIAHGRWEGESTLRNHRGGAPVPVAIASFLIRDAETGEPYALATVQRDISERLAAETALHELADQREALLTRLVDAQDAERAQIAADVHDDPVQALAAVDLRLGQLRRRLRERAPELLDALEPLQASVSGATDRLRALLFDLEPPDLRTGLSWALTQAAEEIFDGTPIRWRIDGADEPEMPDATRAIAYRIAKEALINARKHAAADNVEVTVRGRDAGLEVSVVDDGVGLLETPTEAYPGHRGVFSMQDRATVAGGWCTIGKGDGRGTRVTLWLPGQGPSE